MTKLVEKLDGIVDGYYGGSSDYYEIKAILEAIDNNRIYVRLLRGPDAGAVYQAKSKGINSAKILMVLVEPGPR